MNIILVFTLAICTAASYAVPSAVAPTYFVSNNTSINHNSTNANETISTLTAAQKDEFAEKVKIDQKTFYIHTAKVNWFTALNFCLSKNLQLASVNSAKENEELSAQLEKYYTKFWVSLNNLAKQDEWVWSGTGITASYINWDINEPNNSGGVENCVEMRSPINKISMWNDLPCGFELSFICESPARAESPEKPAPSNPSNPSDSQILLTKVFSWTWTKVL